MPRRIPLVVLPLALLSGCTPMGENVAHRDGSAPGWGDGTRPLLLVRDTPGPAALDASTRLTIMTYGPAIRRSAREYGFDWRLVLAVMKQESRFQSDAESRKGATGLMQLMPLTQREVVDRLAPSGLALDDSTHPDMNIRIGVYYLRTLYSMFAGAGEADRLKLTLASYNAGIGRVHDAQEIAAYLGDNPVKWQAVKAALPFLSKRYASLHGSVWEDGHPRNGSFGGARQTVVYVDAVVSQYETYLRALN